MKTIRRDALLRMAAAGKLLVVDAYRFDDQTGSERSKEPRPVMVMPSDPDWWKKAPADGGRIQGVCYIRASDFSGSGRAYEQTNGDITLIVHSNLNYTFRVVDPKAHAVAVAAQAAAAQLGA